jgi:predicted CoA-substrate-specific enzyme activase
MPVKIDADRPTFGYTCSYVPLEVIHAAGFHPLRIVGETNRCGQDETCLSRNVCPYVHAVLNSYREQKNELSGLIVADSCDGMKKLHDIAGLESAEGGGTGAQQGQVYILSVPRTSGEASVRYFASQLEELYTNLSRQNGIEPAPERLEASAGLYSRIYELLESVREAGVFSRYTDYFLFRQRILTQDPDRSLRELEELSAGKTPGAWKMPNAEAEAGEKTPVLLTGSPLPGEAVLRIIEDAGLEIVLNDSCLDRRWGPRGDAAATAEDPFRLLSRLYLRKMPCARMFHRKEELAKLEALYPDTVKGIIHFRMPFCDLYGFDLVHFIDRLGKERVLSIEADGSPQSEGQIKTRVSAFAEMLRQRKENMKVQSAAGKYFCGIDIGSTTVDGVLLSADGKILAHKIIKTGPGADKTSQILLDDLLAELSASRKDVAFIMATGYGRDSLGFADGTVTEISCHARGTRHLLPGIRFVIDVGGQDSKVIKIDESGKVQDFQMNDKCAAGTGRFLEVMAHALEIDIGEMSRLASKRVEPVPISSVCTVFAESEVISLLGRGHKTEAIVKGLYRSITNRLNGMVRRVGLVTPAAVTGGGALNAGLVRELEERTEARFRIPEVPQIVGAVGAALFGMEAAGMKAAGAEEK